MSTYLTLQSTLRQTPKKWLVTGAAGFIGSHLVETLLQLGQQVVGLDNFATGSQANLDEIQTLVGPEAWTRFHFIQGDICDPANCQTACNGVDFVLHQAALGSVPRSIEKPADTHAANLTGFLNMLIAARDARVKSFVYASSSAVYGDHPDLPKRENAIGRPLSPYALSKWVNELYAEVFARCYGMPSVGLRYFNVFGPRQDPNGAYAAVIPKWIAAMVGNEPVHVNGDGETSRDFCYVANVVQANLLAAAMIEGAPPASGSLPAYAANIAAAGRTTLNQLFEQLRDGLSVQHPRIATMQPIYGPFRAGDVRHSHADISHAAAIIGYHPTHTLSDGLKESLPWYLQNLPSDV